MIFAIAPALLLVLKVTAMAIGRPAAEAEILGGLNGVAGTAAGTAIQEMVKGASGHHPGIIATSVAATAFLFGASGVFFELHGALNTIWKIRRTSRKGLVKGVFTISMVVVVTILVLISLVFDAGITDAGKYAARHFLGGFAFWKTLQLLMSAVVATGLFALMFRFMPDAAVKWRDVATAAAFTAVLFVLGKFALSVYLNTASVGSSFGAAGSIIVVLVWVYWCANIFLFGAEFAHVYATSARPK